jgi:hypothetical protein
MIMLLLLTALSQAVTDGRETLADLSFSSAITIMPDFRVKHVITMRILKGEFDRKDELAIVNEMTNSLTEMKRSANGTIASLPVKEIAGNMHTTYQWGVYCNDIHSYKLRCDKEGDLSFHKSENGYHLIMSQSAEKCLVVPPPTAITVTEVITMPGIVKKSSDCHTAAGRTATTEWTRVDALDRASSDKVRIARKSPRRIDCGPSTLTRSEIELFEKEFTSAMVRARDK